MLQIYCIDCTISLPLIKIEKYGFILFMWEISKRSKKSQLFIIIISTTYRLIHSKGIGLIYLRVDEYLSNLAEL